MSTKPRYVVEFIADSSPSWRVFDTQPQGAPSQPVADCYTEEGANRVAVALNAATVWPPTVLVDALLSSALDEPEDTYSSPEIGQAIREAGLAIVAALHQTTAQHMRFMERLMSRPTMPSMDAGGEHIEAATAGPEPAVGEAVRPAVEPQQ